LKFKRCKHRIAFKTQVTKKSKTLLFLITLFMIDRPNTVAYSEPS